MKRSHVLSGLASVTLAPRLARAADLTPLRIGWVATFSGGLLELAGKAADAAVAAFFKEHGDTVAGRKIELIKRDDGGVAPETAKRLAQELVVNNKVDFLMGLTVSPNAMGVAAVSTQAKVPLFITNASALGILERNAYTARLSYSEAQLTYPLARWAVKNNLKSVYSIVLDLNPGIDAATSFEAAYTAAGGTVLGQVRVPITADDYSPYVQRIRDAKPQAVFAFLTTFGHPFLRAWQSAGGDKSGIKLLATGDLTNESGGLEGLGDAAIGLFTSMNYSAAHRSPLNAQLTRDMNEADPAIRTPDFYSVATYDALHAIFLAAAAQNGNVSADRTMDLVKGMKIESARDPKYWPILEAAEGLDRPIYLHPRDPSLRLAAAFDLPGMSGPLWGYNTEVSMHVMRMYCAGIFARFPRLRIVIGHMGETLPFYLWRSDWASQMARVPGPKFSDVFMQNIAVTTSGAAEFGNGNASAGPALECTIKALGTDNIMWAIDYPYQPMGPAVKFLDEADIGEDDRDKIYHRNAERIFHIDQVGTRAHA